MAQSTPYQPTNGPWAIRPDVPVDGNPPLTIDPCSGELTVQPTLLGSFAVGVRVREYLWAIPERIHP
ncbi:MAG: hypothetical protein R2818_11530 [Flavobacteriales bacterium]